MLWHNKKLKLLLDKWPGKKYFGIYRFLPVFFLMGATLEYTMINWEAGNVNFYKTYKKRRAQELALQEFNKPQ